MGSLITARSLSPVQPLVGKRYWDGWNRNLRERSRSRGNGRVAQRGVTVDYSKYHPDDYLLSWFTAVGGVELEDDGHTIVSPHNKFVNDNGNSWENRVLLESYHSFILAENFTEHVSLPEFSKGKVLDAVAWVVEKQYNGYKEPIPTVFIDCLLATNKKKHPRLVDKVLSGMMNTVSMGCCKERGLVTLADGTRRPIQDIMEGDYVLNGLGQVGRVRRVMVRRVENESIYCGDVVGSPDGFELTGEHPLFMSYGHKEDVQNAGSSSLALPHACEGPSARPDYYRVERMGVHKPRNRYYPRFYVEEVYPRGVFLPSESITDEDAELLGMLAGNGIFTEKSDAVTSSRVELQVNSVKWPAIAPGGRDLHEISCGKYTPTPHHECTEVERLTSFESSKFDIVRKFLTGRVAPEKKFVTEVIYWPHHLQKALIRGYFNTDGDVYTKTLQLKAESRSRDLIDQIYLILLRLGIVANKAEVTHQPTGSSTGKDPYPMYVVRVCSSQNEPWMCDKIPPGKVRPRFNGKAFFRGTSLTRPVREVKTEIYSGLVYNLEIEGDPSYLNNNIRVHNCDVLFTQCSRCGRVVEEGEDKVCDHIQNQLGRYYDDSDGQRRRVSELCGVAGKEGSCVFKELSLVAKPAFMLAKLHGFLDYGEESTGRPLRSVIPYGRYRESNKDV